MLTKKITIITHSVIETQNLAQKLGSLINHPLVIALIGDLGSGKTAFVQGLARGLEVPEEYYITSPTFTLVNEYPGRWDLVHVDLYRLEKIDGLEDIGLDEILHRRSVIAIEWADKLLSGLLADHLTVRMEIIDRDYRRLSLDATGQKEVSLIRILEDAMLG